MTASIGLNLLWLVPGVVGGSEYSTLASLRALAAAAPDDLRYTVFALDDLVDAHPGAADGIDVVPLSLSGRTRPLRVVAESTWLAAQTRRRHLDVVHHMGGTVPLPAAGPAILTVHDLQPLDQPENFTRAKVAYLRAMLPRSIRAARIVVTPSEFVRRSVIARFDVDPDNVIAVHHGVDPPAPAPAADELRARYDLGRRWIVHPAITYPHKGHAVLLDAFATLAASDPDVTLVLTGAAGPAEVAVLQRSARADLSGRVRRTGRIPRDDVEGLIAHAAVLAFPSRYEGFGLPVLEAMVRGTPVVAAATTALPEVVGDAGILLPPDDVAAWREGLRSVLDDPAERDRLVEAGHARAARFTWAKTATGLIDAHRVALG